MSEVRDDQADGDDPEGMAQAARKAPGQRKEEDAEVAVVNAQA